MGKWTQFFHAFGPKDSSCFSKLWQANSQVNGNEVQQVTPALLNILLSSDGNKRIQLPKTDANIKSNCKELNSTDITHDGCHDSSLCSNAPGLALEKFPNIEALLDKPLDAKNEMLRYTSYSSSFMDLGRVPIIACPTGFSSGDNNNKPNKPINDKQQPKVQIPQSIKALSASLYAFANKNYPLDWNKVTKATTLGFAKDLCQKEDPCNRGREPKAPCTPPRKEVPCPPSRSTYNDCNRQMCAGAKTRPKGPLACPPCPPGCSADCVVKIKRPKPKLVCVCRTQMPKEGPSPVGTALKLIAALLLVYILAGAGLFGSIDDTRNFFENLKQMYDNFIEKITGKKN